MSLFSDNLRYLRESLNESQRETADSLDIKRGRYEPWESGKVEPPFEYLVKISRRFQVSTDLLLTTDLRKYSHKEMLKLDDNRVVLPIAVDQAGNDLIEVVPHKARMGYLSGYADPEYIESLQTISLPFLHKGKFRAFPGSGDSMPPHKDSSFIVGRYVEDLDDVKDGRTYILVTKNEGIVYKRLYKSGPDVFTAQSNNTAYKPYEIPFAEIVELWEFMCSLETEEFEQDDWGVETVKGMFEELKRQIGKLG